MYKAIEKNKRNTVLIMGLFVLLIGLIGLVISLFYNDMRIAIFVVIFATIYAVSQYFIANSVALAVTGASEIKKLTIRDFIVLLKIWL